MRRSLVLFWVWFQSGPETYSICTNCYYRTRNGRFHRGFLPGLAMVSSTSYPLSILLQLTPLSLLPRTEWITLIISGLVLALIVLFQPETYAGVLLSWRASHLRRLTGDTRYLAPSEVKQESFPSRLRHALYRPFLLTFSEPIVMLIALYLTVIYIILFTFLDGYTYIFADIHGTNDGLTGLCFLGIIVGLCLATTLVPLIYHWAKKDLEKLRRKFEEEGKDPAEAKNPPEERLWFSLLGKSSRLSI